MTPPVELERPSAREPKHRRLRNDLLKRLREEPIKPGAPFVTETELIHQYAVSNTTARRCLNDLAREGYLVRRCGNGTSVAEMAAVRLRPAFGIVCGNLAASLRSPFLTNLLSGIDEHVREVGGRVGLVTAHDSETASRPGIALGELARHYDYRGLFVLSPLPPVWIADAVASGFPVVAINVDYPMLQVPCVLNDINRSIRLVCSHLMELGHRTITALVGRTPGADDLVSSGAKRAQDELARIQEEGGTDVRLHCAVYDYGDRPGLDRVLAPVFAAGADRPTAVIVSENAVAQVVQDKAQSRGWDVPGDLSIATGEKGSAYSRFTSAEPHMDNLCWRAVRIMEDVLAGRPLARLKELVGCSLVVRASTAPPRA
jgi:GntR family transcriptional regulator, arabinose operon transcriptional repressor